MPESASHENNLKLVEVMLKIFPVPWYTQFHKSLLGLLGMICDWVYHIKMI